MSKFPKFFILSQLNGTNGFAINGISLGDESGSSVSTAGDINGDGLADVLIGAWGIRNFTGQGYVLFGSKGVWNSEINLSRLNGVNGFAINSNTYDSIGWDVSGAGDVNGDGLADVLLGSSVGSNTTNRNYVLFGSKNAWPAEFNLSGLNGTNG